MFSIPWAHARGRKTTGVSDNMLLLNQEPEISSAQTGFLSKYAALMDIALRIGDVVTVACAAYLAARLRFGHWALPQGYQISIVRAALLSAVLFPMFGLYRSWRGARIVRECLRLAAAVTTLALGLLVIAWALKITEHFSRLWLVDWYVIGLAMLILSRITVRTLLGLVRAHGLDVRKVVLVGATDVGDKILKATRERPWMGLEIVGYVATPYDQVSYTDVPCLGALDTFDKTIRTHPPDQLWIALPLRAEDHIRKLLDATTELTTQVRLVPDFFGYALINHHTSSVAGVPIITLRGSRIDGHSRILKAVEDRMLGIIGLILASPIMLLLAVLVKVTSRGPVFYRQKRVGLDGCEFDMLKFRSMPVDSEQSGVRWGQASHKSTTPIGRFIRRTSLDELPQLFNVLKGELSIVGPRPERPNFVKEFRKQIPGYMHKHLVKGGITGLAQVNGWRGDSDLTRRIECDLEYIQHWSIWLDLMIILLTPIAVLRKTNAH